MKRLAENLALSIAGLLLALMVGEIGLRMTGLGGPGLYGYDRERGWALVGGAARWQDREGSAFVRVNGFGFRGPPSSPSHPPSLHRIAVLGDSMTEAAQVSFDQTFCSVMQTDLSSCPALAGRRLEVLNFGVDGYGTTQELLTLRKFVWQFSPDAVVLAFFPSNDIRNNSVVLEGDKCRPFFVYHGDKMVLGGPFVDSRWFHLNCMLRFESRRLAVLDVLGSIHGVVMAIRRRARPRTKTTAHNGPGLDPIYLEPSSPESKDAWRITEEEIAMMNREVKAHGSRFFVAALPGPVEDDTDPTQRARYVASLGVKDLFYAERRIEALGQRSGFPVLSLGPAMEAYAEQNHVFLHGFPNTRMGTGHWNPIGHRVAGHLMAQWICGTLGNTNRADESGLPANNATAAGSHTRGVRQGNR